MGVLHPALSLSSLSSRHSLLSALSLSLPFSLAASPAPPSMSDAVDPGACGDGSPYNGHFGLRVGSIFIILATSTAGALFPIVSRRVRALRVPEPVYDFAR